MKILILTTFFSNSGGGEYIVKHTAEMLGKMGHKVTIVSLAALDKGKFKEIKWQKGKNLFTLNNGPCEVGNSFRNLAVVLNKQKPDVVNIWFGHGFMTWLTDFIQGMGIPVIINILDPWLSHPFYRNRVLQKARRIIPIIDQLPGRRAIASLGQLILTDSLTGKDVKKGEIFKNAKRIIFCSNDIRDFFNKSYRLKRSQSLTVPLFVDHKEFPKVDLTEIGESKHNTLEIVYVGRVAYFWKGFDLLLEAVKNIPNCRLRVFTRLKKDAEYSNIISTKIGLINRIKSKIEYEVNKSREEVFSAMAKADAVVIPSLAEGFSLVMLETMIQGGIVVAGPLFGGPLDVIKNGVNGFLYKAGDSYSLQNTLFIIKQGKLKRKQIALKAVSTAKKYSKDRYFYSLKKLYEGI